MGYREYRMKIGHRQDLCFTVQNPLFLLQITAFRTMPVAAGIVGNAVRAAGVTYIHVTIKFSCTAALNSTQCLLLRERNGM